MSNLVQKNLVDLVVVEAGGEMTRHADPVRREIAQTCSRPGVVKCERPLRRVEVESNERFRPPPHSNQICHPTTITQRMPAARHGIRESTTESGDPGC